MRRVQAALIFLSLSAPATAQIQPASNSAPMAQALNDATPLPRDEAYPGTMTIAVDATDLDRRIFRVRQVIPVASAGPMTLLYPQWLPGNHAPRGQVEKLVGLTISGNGRPIAWTRDPLDVYAFKIDVPDGVKSLEISHQFVSATEKDQGRVVMTRNMLNLQPNSVSLYPAGYYTRRIPVQLTVTYPAGWQAASALRPERTSGNAITYRTTDYDTLVDSPIFAGRYFKAVPLSDKVTLNLVADAPENLAATPEQIELHKRLVREARSLFGTEHFDHYDFLLALTNEMGSIGLEHHRSSENGVEPDYFTGWNKGPGRRNLLPHEMTHSWNGKYRRPAGLWTPDFRTPMQDNLLWIYEGQTQFWGYVLGARSGIYSKQQTLDALAYIAANLDLRVGRNWRSVEDTTLDPIIAARRPKGWTSQQRSEDYYNEGLLIWLEADGIIRQQTRGTKGLDDFAHSFFGGRDGDWGVVPYGFDDVVATLNAVTPYDWAGFLRDRVQGTSREAPKNGLNLGGYSLIYTDQPNSAVTDYQDRTGNLDLGYGPGLVIGKSGSIEGVVWDSPAFNAGLSLGMTIVAIEGQAYSHDRMKNALASAKGKANIALLVKSGDQFTTIPLAYSGGLRYPQLRKTGGGESSIDLLLKARN